MKRTIIIAIVQVTAMALGLAAIFLNMVAHMMEPGSGALDNVRLFCAAAIVATTIAVLVALSRTSLRAPWVAMAAVITLAAGFVPDAAHQIRHQRFVAAKQAEDRQSEIKRSAEVESRKQDVEARIAARRPYTPQESLDFLFFVSGASLAYRGRADHSEAAMATLRRALTGKVIDPNGMIKGPRPVDVEPEPLFLHYYKAWVRPGRPGPVDALKWKIMVVLAGHGADLSLPGAAPLAEDLRKTEVPSVSERFIELK